MRKTNNSYQEQEASNPFALSIGDLMAALLLIFILLLSSTLLRLQEEFDKKEKVATSYSSTKKMIYNDLMKELANDFKKWNIKINPDLSIQISDANALFPITTYTDDIILMPKFQEFLKEFTPRFYKIILKKEYRDAILEVRVEGHTAIQPWSKEYDLDYYQKMLTLSQKRSNKVLEFMMNHPFYSSISAEDKDWLRFILTSNGLAFGKALDKNGEFKFISNEKIDVKNSMRVEFKIVTNSERVIENWLNNE